MATPLVDANAITKRFGGSIALESVDLVVHHGEIHGLVGENGAGKSTLGKIIAGVQRPDSGRLAIDGQEVHLRGPRDAARFGVTLVAQELALVPRLTVTENIFLGVEPSRFGFIDRKALRQAREVLDVLQFDLPHDVPVGDLRIADQQKVEIARAVVRSARLIVLDEPTARLSSQDAAQLMKTMKDLADGGTSMIFVSHALDDVLAVCDTVTVLRDGHRVSTTASANETTASLVSGMIGEALENTFPARSIAPSDSPNVLEVRDIRVPGAVDGVSFEVRAGEILGLAGLVGSGRSELAHAIFGADARSSGTVFVDGDEVSMSGPWDSIAAGIALLPESRKDQGLVLGRSSTFNISLASIRSKGQSRAGFINQKVERSTTSEIADRVTVNARSLDSPVAFLSGGNQQKVMFAKWLLTDPKVLIADEPTRGVDVGAKKRIYQLIAELARSGVAVIVISSELEEVLGLAHRVMVMRNGKLAGEIHSDLATSESILGLAFGTSTNDTMELGQ